MQGFLVFDKPAGITSHDVVGMIRAVTGIRKVGHTGTLDPFATGVLAVAIGPVTRLIQYLDEDRKVYDASIALGCATTTGDPEGEISATAPVPPLTRAQVQQTLASFAGVRMQVPPRYSAVKVRGKPLYAYARSGQDVQASARPVRIDAITLLELRPPHLRVRIQCGKGTYARVLGEEIGEALGTVAHLDGLRREQSGPFTLAQALTASGLAELVAGTPDWLATLRRKRGESRADWRDRAEVRAALAPRLITPMQALHHLPALALDAEQTRRVRQGKSPPVPPPEVTGRHRLSYQGELVALATTTDSDSTLLRGSKLLRVIPHPPSDAPAGSGAGG